MHGPIALAGGHLLNIRSHQALSASRQQGRCGSFQEVASVNTVHGSQDAKESDLSF